MFGSPETTSGGNSLKFYASVRLDIRRGTAIKDQEEVLGNETKVKVVKNKVAPPFKTADFEIIYGEGISRIGEVIELAVKYEILEKSGSWYAYKGSKIGQGKENTKTYLKENPKIAEELESAIREKLGVAKKKKEDKKTAAAEVSEKKRKADAA
jgi:recombination protein RecA